MNNSIKTKLRRRLCIALSVLVTVISFQSLSNQNEVATLRNQTAIDEQKTPNTIPRVVNKDIKKVRNYPMQPPVIPHQIRGYEVNMYNNKCLACHSRQLTEESQAPMISVTHYMNRDGNFLA